MVPVYFQLSKWVYGYFKRPAYDKTYDDPTAIAYAQGLLNQLPNPAAPAVSKLGVEPVPLNLTYIPAGYRNHQNLLQLSCGYPGPNNDQAGKNNGTTSYAQWRTGFRNLFTQDPQLNNIAQPLFSIIDTNSAHHVSAPLVERAVTRAQPPAAIVINYDMHPDYGTGGGQIGCQGWGYYVSNAVANQHGALAQAYVQLGGAPPRDAQAITWDGGQWHQAAGPGGMAVIQPQNNPGQHPVYNQISAVLAAVSQAANGAVVDAYISLDRDLVQTSYTQYDDGKFTWNDSLQGVQACLAALQAHGSHLIGFDVCGLPTRPGVSSKTWVNANDKIKVVDQAIPPAATQVLDLWNLASAYPQ
jgi:hypothetical protein